MKPIRQPICFACVLVWLVAPAISGALMLWAVATAFSFISSALSS